MKRRSIARLHSSARTRLLCSAGIASVLAITATVAAAQEPGADAAFVLPPIIVTGEKVARSLEKTAASVSVLTTDEIDERVEDTTVAEAIENLPNVYAPAQGGQGGTLTIRGQDSEGPNSGATAFFGGAVPRTSVNVDGHTLSYSELVYSGVPLWDVHSVEVFRGPQTTSQGANSIAGAIVVKTKDPTFTPEGEAQLQFGSRNMKRASLAVAGPVTDELAARLSLDYAGRDNYIDYTNPAFAMGDTDQDHESRNLRFKLLWQPKDIAGLEAKLTFAHTDTNRPTWEAATAPYDDLESITLSNPSWTQRTNSTVGEVSYDLGNGVNLFTQLEFSDLHTTRTTEPVTDGSAVIDQRNIGNETRVTFGSEDSGLSGVAGLKVSRTEADEFLNFRGATVYDDSKTSLSLFSELTYRFAERWSLTGGLSYQRDEIKRIGTSSFANAALDYHETFDAWLPKLSLAYDVNDATTIGASVSKGYNPGGVTLDLTTRNYATFEDETVISYEIFGRTRLLDDRMFLTANLFYSDFTDAQRYVVTNLPNSFGSSITVNAEKAKSYGLEVGIDYLALDTLRLKGGLGLLQTEITQFSSSQADYLGNEFGRAPGYMLSLGADWDITPDVRLSGQVQRVDAYYSDDANAAASLIGGYTVANVRVSYAARAGMQLFAYVDNVFDDRSVTYMRASRSVGGFEATTVEPREIGIGMKMTF